MHHDIVADERTWAPRNGAVRDPQPATLPTLEIVKTSRIWALLHFLAQGRREEAGHCRHVIDEIR
jgi:hypothetical protein